jgi:DNA-binding NarL/FixJ family response regulator
MIKKKKKPIMFSIASNHSFQPVNMQNIATAMISEGSPLSQRQTEILQLAANGYTTPKIAAHIYLSKDTIEGYRKEILRKLNAANITHAVAIALRNNWIQ